MYIFSNVFVCVHVILHTPLVLMFIDMFPDTNLLLQSQSQSYYRYYIGTDQEYMPVILVAIIHMKYQLLITLLVPLVFGICATIVVKPYLTNKKILLRNLCTKLTHVRHYICMSECFIFKATNKVQINSGSTQNKL